MPKGVSVPIRVGPNGGAKMLDGSVVIDQNIILALIPAGSLNPWAQHIVPEEDLIYEIKDAETGGLYISHVRQLFEEMDRRGYARLLPGNRGISIVPSKPGEEGDMIVAINYVNLETGKIDQLRVPITGDR